MTAEEMVALQESINRLVWKMQWVREAQREPLEWPTDLRLRGWGKDGTHVQSS